LGAVKVATFNVLADEYIRNGDYSCVDPELLFPGARVEFIVDLVNNQLEADVVGLQEVNEGWTLVHVPEEQRDETIPVRFKPYLKGLLDGSIKLPPLESSPAESDVCKNRV